jgi:ABC-type sugar transport system ATPase subunit
MIAGLEEPTAGDILIAGRSIVALPPHERNVAVAFENYALFPPLTVEENIAFGMRARKEANPRERAREVAQRLGISPLLDRKPGGLSSGQKQRVSLARAIVRKPSVLLLDEPLSHLDASEREQTRRELKHLQRETGYTTVLVTHDQHEALSLADRIAVMDAGVFKQIGTPDEVYDAPANLFVADFVGEPRMNLLNGVLLPGGDGRVMVRLSVDARLTLPAPAAEVIEGERKVTVGIRPQDLRIGRPDEDGALTATVFAHEPLQEVGRLTLTLPGVETRVVVETHHDFWATPGDVLGLHFVPTRTHLFDTETGDRLVWSLNPTPPQPSRHLSPATSSS